MSYSPVANFYSGRITRRALLAAGALAARPGWPSSARDVDRQLIEAGYTYIKPGQGNAIRAAIVVGDRDALAFVTDGSARAQLFVGVAGRSMVLDSVDGSRLSASFRGESWDCWLSRPGTSTGVLSFRVDVADVPAGLFRVELAGGSINGASANDKTLTACIAGTLPDESLVIGGAITDSNGGIKPIAAFLTPDAKGVHWWIVQADGAVAGGCPDQQGYGYVNSHRDLNLQGVALTGFADCS